MLLLFYVRMDKAGKIVAPQDIQYVMYCELII